MTITDAKSYRSFADLAGGQIRGKDYEIEVIRRRSSHVAIIAPHGGHIERSTSEIARAIAGDDFNLYLFEGIKSSGNYAALHLSSHLFDEPECLALIAPCQFVVAIHGCNGNDEKVLLGGRDAALKDQLTKALATMGVAVETDGHRFPALDQNNICNRGRSLRGVQLELTTSLRGSPKETSVVSAVRSVLVAKDSLT